MEDVLNSVVGPGEYSVFMRCSRGFISTAALVDKYQGLTFIGEDRANLVDIDIDAIPPFAVLDYRIQFSHDFNLIKAPPSQALAKTKENRRFNRTVDSMINAITR